MISYPPASYVRRIEIDSLFGEQDIRIAKEASSDPRILVLYGKNGSGKTTILRVLTSLLSAEDNAGHRTRLAKLPFARASVHLDGGAVVEAKKKDGLTGAFDWSIKRQNSQETLHMLLRPRRGRILVDDWDAMQHQRYEQISDELQSLNREVILLDDKRTFYPDDDFRKHRTQRVLADPRGMSADDLEELEVDPVNNGLKAVSNLIRREALLLSNRGSQNAQSIYTSLVKGVSTFPESQPGSSSSLKARLIELEEKSRALSSYGLVAVAEHADLLAALDQANEMTLPLVLTVLSPYVESLSARLGAIETLHKQVDSWVTNINSFIEPKRLSFKVSEGLEIKKGSGAAIPAHVLSSGERHLLMLMTRAFLIRTIGGVMIVDEPELSLNPGWQRNLIRSLLEGFGGGACQLIVASHSLEICSQYQNEVVVI